MKRITFAVDDETYAAARAFAKRHGIAVGPLVRLLLTETVSPSAEKRIEARFKLLDFMKLESKGKRWTRDEIYDV